MAAGLLRLTEWPQCAGRYRGGPAQSRPVLSRGKHDRATLDAGMDGCFPTEREAIRRTAEEQASDNAGPKMIQGGLALDRLLDTVADVAKDMRDEGTKATQRTSLLLVGGSFSLPS